MKTKTAMITIAGRPNVGKSTLTNYLVGEKIAIVSNKPQTTRNRICGIVTRGDTQFVFVDTPGYHRPRTKLGDYMVNVAQESIADVDLTILVVEPIASIGPQEEGLLQKIQGSRCPAVLAINKIDTVEKDKLLEVIQVYSQKADFNAIVPISAKTGDGVEDLLGVCEKYAQEGHFLFPEDVTTDQPERQVMAEIIREKLLWCLDREVPHGTAVEITKFSERDNGIIDIDATIYCQTASTMSHHRVEFMQRINDCFDLFNSFALSVSQFLNIFFFCRNEFMKRRIQETDCNRASLKSLVKTLEVSLLIWKNLVKSNFSLFLCIRTDHLTESSHSLRIEEHMLCTAKSDTFCTELTSLLSISRGISVCTNLKCSELISPSHNTLAHTSGMYSYVKKSKKEGR